MQLSTATPVEIDTELARIQDEISRVHHTLSGVIKKIDLVATDNYARHFITETLEQLDATRLQLGAQLETLRGEAEPLRAEYTRRPWTRYWRVDNSNGHVHTSTACRTTYTTTEFGWLPQVSGATAEEIVEMAGAMTCLVCFPGVREEILAGRPCRLETANQRKTREEQEAAAKIKAEKAAAKAIKAIANPDGSELRIENHVGVIKTVRTAEMVYVDTAAALELYRVRLARFERQRLHGHNVDANQEASCFASLEQHVSDCTVLLTALAHKLGTTLEEQERRLAKKVTARYERDWARY